MVEGTRLVRARDHHRGRGLFPYPAPRRWTGESLGSMREPEEAGEKAAGSPSCGPGVVPKPEETSSGSLFPRQHRDAFLPPHGPAGPSEGCAAREREEGSKQRCVRRPLFSPPGLFSSKIAWAVFHMGTCESLILVNCSEGLEGKEP